MLTNHTGTCPNVPDDHMHGAPPSVDVFYPASACKMCGDALTECFVDRLMYCRSCREDCANFNMEIARYSCLAGWHETWEAALLCGNHGGVPHV